MRGPEAAKIMMRGPEAAKIMMRGPEAAKIMMRGPEAASIMAGSWFADTTITKEDIEEWHVLEGKFCAGCLEGKLKEHARRASTKPLKATRPGENGVGDLMFIEGRHDIKTPFYIHVDAIIMRGPEAA